VTQHDDLPRGNGRLSAHFQLMLTLVCANVGLRARSRSCAKPRSQCTGLAQPFACEGVPGC
jgi:hypothetical protein